MKKKLAYAFCIVLGLVLLSALPAAAHTTLYSAGITADCECFTLTGTKCSSDGTIDYLLMLTKDGCETGGIGITGYFEANTTDTTYNSGQICWRDLCFDGSSVKDILNGTYMITGYVTSANTLVIDPDPPVTIVCEPPRPPVACDGDVKPQKLTMLYTGDACQDNCPAISSEVCSGNSCSSVGCCGSNSQAAGKVKCCNDTSITFPVAEGTMVHIVVNDKDKYWDNTSNVFFNGDVTAGKTFVIDATKLGKNTLPADIRVHIYKDGTWIQSVKFHTSCSQPLAEGDQFGSLKVDELVLVPK